MIEINKIEDLDRLPSVLSIDEVNFYLRQLLMLVSLEDNFQSQTIAENILDVIFSKEWNSNGLSNEISDLILDWVGTTYDSQNDELVDVQSSVLANLTCVSVLPFVRKKLEHAVSISERKALEECLDALNS